VYKQLTVLGHDKIILKSYELSRYLEDVEDILSEINY
jgi:hypothetical protein